ncbi:MAG: thymidine phosphorylase [Candidatus Hydrothermales bacterium]
MEPNILRIIEKKRDGKILNKEEIEFFVEGVIKGKIPDYQISALLMAIFFQGLNDEETFFLTKSMRDSGKTIDILSVHPLLDKHSTGGVGDKVSLALAPIMASLGVYIPMISGRALGHTGGTVDKLESIPGYKTDLTIEEFRKIVKTIGCSIIGQTEEIAPADRIIYSIRDVTGTVPSIPLITASILSKKLSVNLDGIIFDVKTGLGAFMRNYTDAEKLAKSLVNVSNKMGVKAKALITDMNEPLGYTAGNRIEIMETIFYLNGAEIKDLDEVVKSLAAELLLIGEKISDRDLGKEMVDNLRKNGKALKKFFDMVKAHGGLVEEIEFLKIDNFIRAKYIEFVEAEIEGYISKIDAKIVGEAARILGAGRLKKEDKIDPVAGIILHKKTGSYVKKGEKIFEIRTNSENKVEEAKKLLLNSLDFNIEKPSERTIIYSLVE